MPKRTFTVETPIDAKSFRVSQVCGMFDVPASQRAQETFSVELPGLEEKWQVGLIVGPSGSGKSTVASQAFGQQLYQPGIGWPEKQSVLDGFPEDLEAKAIFQTLTAVGFSSPPSWVKPYSVLSNGEKFRCDLARSLAQRHEGTEGLVVFDEFTSVVDRTVAKVGSLAVAKLVRSSPSGLRFVAVTCHYDVAPWLSPDWILDMASGELTRRRLRRPALHLEIFRSGRAAWGLFKKHHYLSHSIPGGAQIYVAWLSGMDGFPDGPSVPVGIVIVGQHFGNSRRGETARGTKTISRIVVLPDYQGIGIGSRLLDGVARILQDDNWRVSITTSHPGMIAHLRRSAAWKVTACAAVSRKVWTTGKAQQKGLRKAGAMRSSLGRVRCSASYAGELT